MAPMCGTDQAGFLHSFPRLSSVCSMCVVLTLVFRSSPAGGDRPCAPRRETFPRTNIGAETYITLPPPSPKLAVVMWSIYTQEYPNPITAQRVIGMPTTNPYHA